MFVRAENKYKLYEASIETKKEAISDFALALEVYRWFYLEKILNVDLIRDHMVREKRIPEETVTRAARMVLGKNPKTGELMVRKEFRYRNRKALKILKQDFSKQRDNGAD